MQPHNIIDKKIDDSIPRTALTSNGNFLICCQEKIISQTKTARIGIHAVSSLNPHPCGFLLNIMQHIRKYHHSPSCSLRNVTIHFSHIKILRLNCYKVDAKNLKKLLTNSFHSDSIYKPPEKRAAKNKKVCRILKKLEKSC